MQIVGFGGGLMFAVSAAAGLIPFWLLTAGVVGSLAAFGSYLLLLVVVYVGMITVEPAPVVRAALWAGAGAVLVAVTARTPWELCIGAALLLAASRGVGLRQRTLGWSFAEEATQLILVACLVPTFVAGGTVLHLSLAVWGFFLAQAVGLLLPRRSVARPGAASRRPPPAVGPSPARS